VSIESPASRLISQPNLRMPTQDTQSQIVRKVKLAIQLLRETADLLEGKTPQRAFSPKRTRYPRRRNVEERAQ